jgi:hypothetical protein
MQGLAIGRILAKENGYEFLNMDVSVGQIH